MVDSDMSAVVERLIARLKNNGQISSIEMRKGPVEKPWENNQSEIASELRSSLAWLQG